MILAMVMAAHTCKPIYEPDGREYACVFTLPTKPTTVCVATSKKYPGPLSIEIDHWDDTITVYMNDPKRPPVDLHLECASE